MLLRSKLLKRLNKIPRPILIYLASIGGLVLVILATFGVSEIMSRLKPPEQYLYIAEDESSAAGFLTIHVWENVWNEDKTVESTQLTELELNEPVYVGRFRIARDVQKNQTTEKDEIYYYHAWGHDAHLTNTDYHYVNAVFVAVADAELTAINSYRGRLHFGTPEGNYLTPLTSEYHGGSYLTDNQGANSQMLDSGFEVSGRYEMFIVDDTTSDTVPLAIQLKDASEFKTGDWDGSAYNREYYETLREVNPQISGVYGRLRRTVNENALLIRAYDKSDPDKLVAEAVIKLTFRSAWDDAENALASDETVNDVLYSLGLHKNPDNYGCATAELVEYWQSDT